MTGNEYQQLANVTNDGKSTQRLEDWSYLNTRRKIFPDTGAILNACLGLSGEVGEFNDLIKKAIFHEKPIDIQHAKKELGDILWYVSLMCTGFGWDMNEIMQMNIDKLKARYPDGFDIEKANNRKKGDV
jgi:NTP pyrophosphatase (non-canonical NTP hydrolase)